eukprot:16289816-Heterocapsa_arctica.AAC.1
MVVQGCYQFPHRGWNAVHWPCFQYKSFSRRNLGFLGLGQQESFLVPQAANVGAVCLNPHCNGC